ncbi:MAG: dockerin type I domain-containing protein, partial [Planctomycetota bacterium]
VEGLDTSIEVTVIRSNTDDLPALEVTLQLNSDQLDWPEQIDFATDASRVVVALPVLNDDVLEDPIDVTVSAEATGYARASAMLTIYDDEKPYFQNPADRFDTNGVDGVSPLDALVVINELTRQGSDVSLSPSLFARDGRFLDVTGDYVLSPLDALQVINELTRQAARLSTAEGESQAGHALTLGRAPSSIRVDEAFASDILDDLDGQPALF